MLIAITTNHESNPSATETALASRTRVDEQKQAHRRGTFSAKTTPRIVP